MTGLRKLPRRKQLSRVWLRGSSRLAMEMSLKWLLFVGLVGLSLGWVACGKKSTVASDLIDRELFFWQPRFGQSAAFSGWALDCFSSGEEWYFESSFGGLGAADGDGEAVDG